MAGRLPAHSAPLSPRVLVRPRVRQACPPFRAPTAGEGVAGALGVCALEHGHGGLSIFGLGRGVVAPVVVLGRVGHFGSVNFGHLNYHSRVSGCRRCRRGRGTAVGVGAAQLQ